MRSIIAAFAATVLGLLVMGCILFLAYDVFDVDICSAQAFVAIMASIVFGGYFAGIIAGITRSVPRWLYLLIGPGTYLMVWLWLFEEGPDMIVFSLVVFVVSVVGVMVGVRTAGAWRRFFCLVTKDLSANP